MFKKTLAVLLAALVILQMLPMSVFAAEIIEQTDAKTSETAQEGLLSQEEVSQARIIGEDISLREEFVKHFRTSDGGYIAAVYDYPIHYQTETGWEELDLTLEKTTDEDTGKTVYSTQEQSITVSVPEDITEGKLSYAYKGQEISLSYLGKANPGQEKKKSGNVKVKKTKHENYDLGDNADSAQKHNQEAMAIDNLSMDIIYSNADDNVDLEYTIHTAGIKENIIVSEPENNYLYTFLIEAGGLTPSVQNDNTVAFIDTNTDETVFILDAPVMFDAAGAESSAIKLKIKEKNGKYELIVHADKKWINDKAREFPVTIDPTVTLNIPQGNISDTYADKSEAASTHAYDYYVYSGNSSLGLTRAYVKFNLPTLPKNSMIVSAVFYMFQYDCDYTSANATATVLSAYDLKGKPSWTPTSLTWNNQPVGSAVNAANSMTALDFCYLSPTANRLYSWDITKAAKNWYEKGESENNGILIAASKETVNSMRARFYSSNNTQVTSNGFPGLYIAYRDTRGLEDYWSYSSFSAGDAGTAYINDYNGNLIFVRDDTATYGLRMPITVSHIYNLANTDAQSGYKPSTGRGWQLSIQQKITATTNENNFTSDLKSQYPYAYHDGDGTVHYLAKKSGSSTQFEDEDGLGLTMTVNASSTSARYSLKDNNDNIMEFDSTGRIAKIKDSNNQAITLTYTGEQLTSIKDGANHEIKLTKIDGQLTQTTVFDGRTNIHTYQGGKLTGVKLLNGRTVSYTYDTAGRLATATDSTGRKLQFAYTSTRDTSRISKITIYEGNVKKQTILYNFDKHNTTTIAYSMSKAEITGIADNDAIITEKQFDNFGRLIASNESGAGLELGAQTYTYIATASETDDRKNRIASAGTQGAAVDNILLNPNFEAGATSWQKTSNIQSPSSAQFGTTSKSYYGKKSAYISVQTYSDANEYRIFQDLDLTRLTPGATYTASIYVNIASCRNVGENGGVFLQVRCQASASSYNKANYSERLTSETSTDIDGGWRRLTTTFTVPQGATRCYVAAGIQRADANVYFDAVQIEKGESANAFNLLENTSFENGTNHWTRSASAHGNTSTTYKHSGSKSYRLTGDPTYLSEVSQTVPLPANATENDTFLLSVWVRANAVSVISETGDKKPQFRIGMEITYTDGSKVNNRFINGNTAVSEPQFLSGAFNLDDGSSTVRTPQSIRIFAQYTRQAIGNPNKAYFDDFYLTRENAATYKYNSKGNLVSIADGAKRDQAITYSANGTDISQLRDAESNIYKYTYDNKHNLTCAESTNGVKYNYTYNGSGNVTNLKVSGKNTAEEIASAIEYTDNDSLVRKTTDANDNTIIYTYSGGRNTGITDAKSHSTTFFYDDAATKNLIQVASGITANGSYQAARVYYAYDSSNRLSTITANTQYGFQYDAGGRLSKVTAGGATIAEYTYNNVSGLLAFSYIGDYISYGYTYDKAGRLTEKRFITQPAATWKYDNQNRVTEYNDLLNQQKHLYTNDSSGRFIRESVIDTAANRSLYVSEYDYDLNSNITKIAVETPDGALSAHYTYGNDNLPTSVQSATLTTNYTYDGLNRLSVVNSPDTPKRTYTYKTGTTLLESESFDDSKLGTNAYSYDANGNITGIFNFFSESGSKSSYFTYDQFNRLTQERNSDLGKTIVYAYDKWGNILSKKIYNGTASNATSSTPEQTIHYTYKTSGWKDRLTSYNGQSITYDAAGNPLNYRGASLAWESRILMEYTKGATSVDYGYDSEGQRVSKTVNGVKYDYYYVDGKLMVEHCPSYTLFYSYDANGNLYAIKKQFSNSSYEYYYAVCNSRGDVLALYNEGGNLECKYYYDSWGKLISVADHNGNSITAQNHIAIQNSIRYRGYVYDTETGLYYLNSRYYDPETCRFIDPDATDILTATPMGLTDKNLYAYCDSNPLSRADVEGDFWHIVIGAAVGGVIGGIVSVVSNAVSGEPWNKNLGTAILASAAGGALGASGVGAAGMIVGSAAISMAENTINQVSENKGFQNFNIGDMLIDTAIGGIFGAIGGPGTGNKHLNNLGKQTIVRTKNTTVKKGLKAGVSEAAKAFSYYKKNTRSYYRSLRRNIPVNAVFSGCESFFTSDLMKRNYSHLFGG